MYSLQIEPAPKLVRSKSPKEKRDRSRDRFRDRSRDRSRGLTRTVDSDDLLFNFSEDDEMDRINRKALLGMFSGKINKSVALKMTFYKNCVKL